MSSAIDADYSNLPLYGVFQTEGDAAFAPFDAPNYVIEGDAGNTDLHGILSFGVKGVAPNTSSKVTGLFSITAGDFINGGVSAGDTISSISLDIQDVRGDTLNSTRLAVQSGGAWFLSDVAFTGSQTGTNLTYTGGTWAAFTPATASSASLMTGEGLIYDVNGSSLDSIEAVGFFFEGETAGTARARLRIQGFEVHTIPEPATLGLLGVAGTILFLVRRRRRT
jgi:hypothetical protein